MSKEFESHSLNKKGLATVDQTRKSYETLLSFLKDVCPEGRELAIVRTKLEEACFFSVKAVAVYGPNQAAPKEDEE